MLLSTWERSRPAGKALVLRVPVSGLERSRHGQAARPRGAAGEGPSMLQSAPVALSAALLLAPAATCGSTAETDRWLPSRLWPQPLEYFYSSTFGNTQNSFLLKTMYIIEVLKLQDSPWCCGWSLDTSEKFLCSSFFIICFALSKSFHR